MKMRMIFAAACLALASCGPLAPPTSVPAAPVVVADRTTADEQGMLAVELAYKAARLSVETAVDAGLLKGDRAAQFAQLDTKAYGAVLAARSAYRTANAASYGAALASARAAVQQLLGLAQH